MSVNAKIERNTIIVNPKVQGVATPDNIINFDTNILTQMQEDQLIRGDANGDPELFYENSKFVLSFDGGDYYNLPLALSGEQDFDFSFKFLLNSRSSFQVILDCGYTGGDNSISLNINTIGRFIFVAQCTDSTSISIQTSVSVTGMSYIIRIKKTGSVFYIYKNGILEDSDTITSTMDFDSFDYAKLSDSSGGILSGNKISNWKGLWTLPGLNSDKKYFTDTAKTIEAQVGNTVAVIETPEGDITQSTAGARAVAESPTFGLQIESIIVALSDETTVLGAASDTTPLRTFYMPPYATRIVSVGATLNTAGTGAALVTVDIHESGTTILSTKITIDASETTSETATTAPVISDYDLAANAKMEFFLDQRDTNNVAKGLKVRITYYRV